MLVAVLAAALTISVNNSPLHSDAPPLESGGRVLLPARAVFDALGASVTYRGGNRSIVVRRGDRLVRLMLGSNVASVSGRNVPLDAPPRIYNGRTYVPLRFIAQALGADVYYDGNLRVVAIDDPRAPNERVVDTGGGPPNAQRGFANAFPGIPTVENQRPAQGESVTGAYPSISASLQTHGGPPIDPASVRMFLDGRDVTARMFRSGDTIGYTPAFELPGGSHEVTVQGADTGGARFSATWNFQSTFAYAPGQTAPNMPPPGNPYYDQPISVYLNGGATYGYGSVMQVFVVGPPNGSGYVNLCGYGRSYPLTQWLNNPTRYYATIPVPANVYAPQCYVNGYFYGPNGFANYLALPTPIVINTIGYPYAPGGAAPTAKPFPVPSPSFDPSRRRVPLGVPTPTVMPIPHPTPPPTPRPTFAPRAARTPAPPRPKPTPDVSERPGRQPL